MPQHFIPSASSWSLGGHLGAPFPTDPATIPPRIIGRWMDADGVLRVGELDVIDTTADVPGEIPWEQIVDFTDITKIR